VLDYSKHLRDQPDFQRALQAQQRTAIKQGVATVPVPVGQ